MPDKVPECLPDRMPEDCQNICQTECQKICQHALSLGREAGTMEQLPTVTHTYNLSSKQSKKKRNTHGTSWNRSCTQAYADTFDIPRALLISKHLPKSLLFHMTSSERKTSPVHVTTSQQLLCTWTYHRECFSMLATDFLIGLFVAIFHFSPVTNTSIDIYIIHTNCWVNRFFFYNASALKHTFHNLQRTLTSINLASLLQMY